MLLRECAMRKLHEAGISPRNILLELKGLQPGTNKRPGDVTALNYFFGDGQHLLLIDVAFTTVWSNSNVSQYSSFPGAAAFEKRELDKIINKDKLSVSPVSRVFDGDNVPICLMLWRMMVGQWDIGTRPGGSEALG